MRTQRCKHLSFTLVVIYTYIISYGFSILNSGYTIMCHHLLRSYVFVMILVYCEPHGRPGSLKLFMGMRHLGQVILYKMFFRMAEVREGIGMIWHVLAVGVVWSQSRPDNVVD